MAPTIVSPSSETPSHLPSPICQATIASCPAVFISPLAKHWPTYTSALRVSRYWPLIWGVTLVGAAGGWAQNAAIEKDRAKTRVEASLRYIRKLQELSPL